MARREEKLKIIVSIDDGTKIWRALQKWAPLAVYKFRKIHDKKKRITVVFTANNTIEVYSKGESDKMIFKINRKSNEEIGA